MNYLFMFGDGSSSKINANKFKMAVWEAAKYVGIVTESSDIFKKSLNGFDEADVEGIVKLFNHFAVNYDYSIIGIYEINKTIFQSFTED